MVKDSNVMSTALLLEAAKRHGIRRFVFMSSCAVYGDVAAIVLNLLTSPTKYSHLNIGTGAATKISTLVGLVLKQFPQLAIRHGVTQEAEYSRADIDRLRESWKGDFVRIEDYVRDRFSPERWETSRFPDL